MLSPDERTLLQSRIEGIRSDGLGSVVLAVVRSTGDKTADRAARDLYENWRLDAAERTLPFGRIDRVMLLVVIDSPGSGRCSVVAGGGDGAAEFSKVTSEACARTLEYNLRTGRPGIAVKAVVGLLESRMRTVAGIGLAPPAEPRSSRPPPRGVLPPALLPPARPIDWKPWILGSAAVAAALVLLAVVVRRRASVASRPCENCGRPMELASERTRSRLLNDAQEKEELIGNVRYAVWACRCGQTRVEALR